MAPAPRSRYPSRSKKAAFDTFQFDGSARCLVLVCRDSFLRSHYTGEVARILESVHGEIDRFEFDGESDTAGDLLEELRAVGLLHAHKLVILDKADRFLVSKGGGRGRRRSRQESQGAQSPSAVVGTLCTETL